MFLVVFLPLQVVSGRSYKGKYPDLKPLFEKPKIEDQALGLGIAVGSLLIPTVGPAIVNPVIDVANKISVGVQQAAGISSTAALYIPNISAPALESATLVSDFSQGAFIGTLAEAGTLLAVREFGANPETAQIIGYGVLGGLTGMFGGATGALEPHKLGWLGEAAKESPLLTGLALGTLQGAFQGGGVILAEKAGLPPSFGSLVANTGSYIGFNALLNIPHGITTGDFNPMWASWGDKNFLRSLVSQGVTAGIDLALEDKKYASLISQPIGQMAAAAIVPLIPQAKYKEGKITEFKTDWNKEEYLSGIRKAAVEGLILGGIDVGVDSIKGLTSLQKEDLRFLASSLINVGFLSKDVGLPLRNLQTNLSSFGHTKTTEPSFSLGTWNSFKTNEALANFAGIANFYRSSQQLMHQPADKEESRFLQRLKNINYRLSKIGRPEPSWQDLVSTGKVRKLFPSLDAMLIGKVTSGLSGAASDDIDLKPLFEKKHAQPPKAPER